MTDSELTTKVTPLLKEVEQAIAISSDDMLALGETLKGLWDDAVARNDERAMALIEETWNKAQALQQDAATVYTTTVAIATVATEAVLQREAVQQELDMLNDAIESGDDSHPRLQDFAETIRQDAREEYEEWMQDEGWPEAMAEAFEEIRVEMVSRIRDLADCDYETANRFARIMMGRRAKFTVYQEQVFKNLLANMNEQFEAVAS